MPNFSNRLRPFDFAWAVTGLRFIGLWVSAFLGLLLLLFAFSGVRDLLTRFPLVIQLACAVLVVLTGVLMGAMIREQRAVLRAHRQFRRAFDSIAVLSREERTFGISPDKMDEVRRRAATLRGQPRRWWLALEETFEEYRSPDGRPGWFLTHPVQETLTDDELIYRGYHASFHRVVPSVLTSLGLLATFVAILQALAGVTYNAQDPLHPVSGMDMLINGLSGKFLSSIVALLLSVTFTLVERKLCERQITEEYEDLVARCKELFPFLSPSRILLDVQRLLSGQVAAPRDMEEADRR